MRIGIDYHTAFGMPEGSKTYITNLAFNLPSISNGTKYVLYAPRGTIGRTPQTPNARIRYVLSSDPFRRLIVELPYYIRRDDVDIFHSIYICPPWKRCRYVLTVHDILFEHYPNLFTRTFVLRSKAFIRLSVKRADAIITISDYSRKDISSTYGIDEEKIVVTPLGVDKIFRPNVCKETLHQICRKYGINQPYILFVGRLEPRKNIPTLLKAFSILLKEGLDDYILVLVGPKDFGYDEIFREVSRLKIEGNIVFAGAILLEELQAVMAGAKIFVYPALYEGFGLPVLEAMACGIPVVTSNTSALAEIVGDDGVLVDPFSVESLADGMRRLLTDSFVHYDLKQRVLEKAKLFTWKRCAERTYQVYQTLI